MLSFDPIPHPASPFRLTSKAVQDSPELQRILKLPRRAFDPAFAQQMAEQFTQALKTPRGAMQLRPLQGQALYELHEVRGLVAFLSVGAGKTILSALSPRVLGSERPLLLVPGALKGKTEDEFAQLRKHFFLPPFLRVEGYEWMALVQAEAFLNRYRPDVIIADESHRLKNTSAACTKRVRRYLQANEHCRFVMMSGTPSKRSIRDYAHLIAWALRDLSPLPRQFNVLMEWAGALDAGNLIQEFSPGALALLGDGSEPVVDVNSARRAFRKRLVETPGVVVSLEDELGVSLQLNAIPLEPPKVIQDAQEKLDTMWMLPDDHEIIEAVEHWRHSRELALGFFYKWDPWPPESWINPRKAWHAALRNLLKHNNRRLDTDAQLRRAMDHNPSWYPTEYRLYKEWEAVKDTFEPNTVPVWLSDHAIEFAHKWVKKNKGIVWVEHAAFGERFQDVTGIRCYGAEGLDRDGNYIENHPHNTPLAALVSSNATGRNLQFGWSRCLFVSPPPTGLLVEQAIGRIHRTGQEADTVIVDFLIPSRAHANAIRKAIEDSENHFHSTGMPRKILYGDKTFDPNKI